MSDFCYATVSESLNGFSVMDKGIYSTLESTTENKVYSSSTDKMDVSTN